MDTISDRPETDWHIRVPAPDELRAFMVPVQLAFAEDFSEAELDDWLKLVEPDRWLGAFEAEGSELVVGCASALSLRLTVPGSEVAAAGVTGVGVRPDHRRRGVLRALMRRQLGDVRERGEPIAALWASEGAIYGRFGYGLAAMDGFFEVETRRTDYARERPTEGRVRIVEEDEAASLIPPLYETMRSRTPGALSRSRTWWQSATLADPDYSRHGFGPKFRVVYEADGRPEGYAIYRIKDDWDHRGPKNVLQVNEAVTNTPRASRELWRYLFDVDLVEKVRSQRVPVPALLQHLLAEPRALGLVVNDGLWIRIVDVPEALAARRYGATDELVLEVSDELYPSNAGRWRIVTAGEPGAAVAEVARVDDDPDLMVDVADLAAVYLGGVRPSDLAAAGRIVESTSGAVVRANALFTADRMPWCNTMF